MTKSLSVLRNTEGKRTFKDKNNHEWMNRTCDFKSLQVNKLKIWYDSWIFKIGIFRKIKIDINTKWARTNFCADFDKKKRVDNKFWFFQRWTGNLLYSFSSFYNGFLTRVNILHNLFFFCVCVCVFWLLN